MPSKMNFELPIEWIPKEVYQAALKYVEDFDKLAYVEDDSQASLTMYFVSKSQIYEDTHALRFASVVSVTQFEATLRGELPRGVTWNNFKSLVKMALGLAKVYVSRNPLSQVMECEANPLNLMCLGCPAFQGKGICSHVIAATHIHYALLPAAEEKPQQFNLFYLHAKLYGKTGKRSAHRSKNAPGALHVDPDNSADEDDELGRTRYNWWKAAPQKRRRVP